MNLLFVSFILISAVQLTWSAETKTEAIKENEHIHKMCSEGTEITRDTIEKINKDKILPTDQTFKCYTHCIMLKLDLADDKGYVDVDKIYEFIPTEIKTEENRQHIHLCASSADAVDACDRVWELHQCFIDKASESYFII